jgi:hypothetical protein
MAPPDVDNLPMTTREQVVSERPITEPRSRPVRTVVVTVGLVALLAAGGWLVQHVWAGSNDGPTINYPSAQAMAQKAGCASTFAGSAAYEGVTSTGSCVVNGSTVLLVVLPSTDMAYAWFDGAQALATTPHHGTVGAGWVAYGTDLESMNAVSQALTTP